jgi:hypothetical protein
MAAKIVQRGFSPKDSIEFGEVWRERMTAAACDSRYLINRGYDIGSAVTFTGNHFLLSERQRAAIVRGIATEEKLRIRREKEIQKPSGVVYIDGFNVIITLEVALSGSLLLLCCDGTIRDLAGLHGSYRIVDKTHIAVGLLLNALGKLDIREAMIYLDQPVSNSGRLKTLIGEMIADREFAVTVELRPDVDKQLYHKPQVMTSDAIVLDECGGWYNLNRRLIEESVPDAWIYAI